MRCSFCGRTTRRSGSRRRSPPSAPAAKSITPPFGQPLFVGVFLVEGPAPAAGFREPAPRCVGRRRVVRLDSGGADRLPRYGGFAVGALRRRVEDDVGRRVGRLSARRVLRRTRPRPAARPAASAVRTYGCDTPAGTLSPEWAAKLGLSEAGSFHREWGMSTAHSGAVGAGICHGTVVLNLGTSACYMGRHAARKDGRPGGRRHFRSGGRLDTSRHGRIRSGGCRPSATCTRGSSACSAGRCAKCCCGRA